MSKSTISLTQILGLVGKLGDEAGDDTPRIRFRKYLESNVKEIGQIRDYIEECLRLKGQQYNYALQDLINHLGSFLGFEVHYGRYRGVVGEIGFDGHWISPTGFNIVIEVKTTETYAIKTSTLVGYCDDLISENIIPSWENTLGLYIVGRPDPEVKQLENSIKGEKRIDQLRTISVKSLISLAEIYNEYDVNHNDILSILRPSKPNIDPVVDLIAGLVAQAPEIREEQRETSEKTEKTQIPREIEKVSESTRFWLTPVSTDEHATAKETVKTLVDRENIYAFGERTPGRKHIKPGDYICFYESGNGVIGHAIIESRPRNEINPNVKTPEKYPWIFDVKSPKLYLEDPIVIDAELRSKLDEFKNRDPNKPWGWFVQSTREITKHDFEILTRSN
jgi:hypothetical protein